MKPLNNITVLYCVINTNTLINVLFFCASASVYLELDR